MSKEVNPCLDIPSPPQLKYREITLVRDLQVICVATNGLFINATLVDENGVRPLQPKEKMSFDDVVASLKEAKWVELEPEVSNAK